MVIKMYSLVLAALILSFEFAISSDIGEEIRNKKAHTVHDVDIVTVTSLVGVTLTSTIVLPSCTYYLSTSTITSPCVYLNIGANAPKRRLRRLEEKGETKLIGKSMETLTKNAAEDIPDSLDPSQQSTSSDEAEARILQPLNWSNVVTSTITATTLVAATTTTTIATVTTTVLQILPINVMSINSKTGGAIPRCSSTAG